MYGYGNSKTEKISQENLFVSFYMKHFLVMLAYFFHSGS